MGYFDGLTDASFKTDAEGRTVYYRWGVLAKGRVLPDEETKARLRKFVKTYYMVSLLPVIFLVPFLNIFVRPLWMILIGECIFISACVTFYLVRTAAMVRGLPVSEHKLRLGEAYSNSARSHNLPTLVVLLVFSILFVVAGAWISIRRPLIGAITVLFFGACTVAIGYMVRAKIAQRRSELAPLP